MSYTQLTEVERYQIQSFLKAGYTQKAIAEELGRNPETISRELGRNTWSAWLSTPAEKSNKENPIWPRHAGTRYQPILRRPEGAQKDFWHPARSPAPATGVGLHQMTTMEVANAYLKEHFIPAFNEGFGVQTEETEMAFVP